MSTRTGPSLFRFRGDGNTGAMGFLLWILAVILVVAGIVNVLQGQLLLGIVLVVLGLAVGPGGFSVFHSRRA